MRRAMLFTILLALPAGLGCGIPQNVSDECAVLERSYEWEARKLSGLRSRNVPPGSPTYQFAAEQLRKTREDLLECRATPMAAAPPPAPTTH